VNRVCGRADRERRRVHVHAGARETHPQERQDARGAAHDVPYLGEGHREEGDGAAAGGVRRGFAHAKSGQSSPSLRNVNEAFVRARSARHRPRHPLPLHRLQRLRQRHERPRPTHRLHRRLQLRRLHQRRGLRRLRGRLHPRPPLRRREPRRLHHRRRLRSLRGPLRRRLLTQSRGAEGRCSRAADQSERRASDFGAAKPCGQLGNGRAVLTNNPP